METDLKKIKKLSKKKWDENWEFRSFLKWGDIPGKEIDLIVHRLYKKISSEIDCKKCANCCIVALPILDQKDIEKLSKGLGISVAQFKDKYLIEDEKNEGFTFNKKPCPLLKDNSCSCLPYQPKECKSYPHLHKKDFTSRLISVIENCSVCPIVFNVYETLKDEIW